MLNYNKIWELASEKNIKKSQLARYANMGETGFRQMMERKTMTVETLCLLLEKLGKPVSYFFDEPEPNTLNEPIPPYHTKCKNPECIERISELERDKANLEQLKILLTEENERLKKGGLTGRGESEGGMEKQRNAS